MYINSTTATSSTTTTTNTTTTTTTTITITTTTSTTLQLAVLRSMKVIPFRLSLSDASLNSYPTWMTIVLSHVIIPTTADSTTAVGLEEKMMYNINNSSAGHGVGYGRSSILGCGGDDGDGDIYSRRSEKDSDIYGQSVDFYAASKSSSNALSGSNSAQNSTSSRNSSNNSSSGRSNDADDSSSATAFDYWMKTFETGT